MVKLTLTDGNPERDRELWKQFTQAVDLALEDGVSQDASIRVSMAYAELPDRSSKGRARAMIQESTSVALSSGDTTKAQHLDAIASAMRIKNGINIRTAQRYTRFMEDAEALQIAFGMMVLNPPEEIVPLLKPDWLQNLSTENSAALVYRAWLEADPQTRGDEPVASEVEKRAARISLGKAPMGTGRKPGKAKS